MNVLMLDGHVRSVGDNIRQLTWQLSLVPDDRQVMPDDWEE